MRRGWTTWHAPWDCWHCHTLTAIDKLRITRFLKKTAPHSSSKSHVRTMWHGPILPNVSNCMQELQKKTIIHPLLLRKNTSRRRVGTVPLWVKLWPLGIKTHFITFGIFMKHLDSKRNFAFSLQFLVTLVELSRAKAALSSDFRLGHLSTDRKMYRWHSHQNWCST